MRFLYLIASKLRIVLPARCVRWLRGIVTALLTPLLWTTRTAHWKSSLTGTSIDVAGPVPWYTYPAINFLQAADFSGLHILEFGAGNSTMWWASRALNVVALESDAEWFDRLSKKVPPNVSIHLVADRLDERALEVCQQSAPYDVIIIDGLDRLSCSLRAQHWISETGAIILDNSEGYWGGDADGSYPIIEHFHSLGFQRADFYGHAPSNSRTHCTSIFFKNACFLFSSANAPRAA